MANVKGDTVASSDFKKFTIALPNKPDPPVNNNYFILKTLHS
jgi:hypothetical protein